MILNTFAPTRPHAKQQEVLQALDNGQRFVQLRAGRKFRKTSMMISWLFEGALESGLVCPYVAPSRVQAKNIAWRDHVARVLNEFRAKGIPYTVNESDLSVSVPNGGKIQLYGVENKEGLRGISNWGRIALDEYDDWAEDIWPTIIRPNLMVHKAPAIIGGTPKGFKNLYRLESNPAFKCFHFTSYDNPDLDEKELQDMVKEYKGMGEDYFQQEIMAEYTKPVGTVYKEWPLENFRQVEYDPYLPLHLALDFGVNDPTVILWMQRQGGEFRMIDHYESSNADVAHFVQVIRSKPYKTPDMVVGDPAGRARSIVTATSPIDEYAKHGIFIRVKDGVTIPDQIRMTHKHIRSMFVSDKLERARECILNYKYPQKGENIINQSNEIPIHDEFSHTMRALEYYFTNVETLGVLPTTIQQNQNIKNWAI